MCSSALQGPQTGRDPGGAAARMRCTKQSLQLYGTRVQLRIHTVYNDYVAGRPRLRPYWNRVSSSVGGVGGGGLSPWAGRARKNIELTS